MALESDEYYLKIALELARAAEQQGEVPVGALIVDNATGEILSRAGNAPIGTNDPTAHAEIAAIRDAAIFLNNYRLIDTSLYVTLEPCAMCAGAIAHARISQVIYAASDEKGGAVDNGVRYFDQPTCHWHPDVRSGTLEDESAELLRAFFKKRRK